MSAEQGHGEIPTVDDDALHIENPKAPGMTLCGRMTTADTNLGTYDELRAIGDCWMCADICLSDALWASSSEPRP